MLSRECSRELYGFLSLEGPARIFYCRNRTANFLMSHFALKNHFNVVADFYIADRFIIAEMSGKFSEVALCIEGHCKIDSQIRTGRPHFFAPINIGFASFFFF